MSKSIRINHDIRSKELRVVDADGAQLGVMDKSKALELAQEAGLDLVEISPNANPPVAKIIDWGKYQYQKMKELRKNRKNSKTADLKQMKFGLKIGENDLEIKLRKIRQFLEAGHKVKILIFFRGREIAHQELGYDMINQVLSKLEEVAVVEQKPQMFGRSLSAVIRSK